MPNLLFATAMPTFSSASEHAEAVLTPICQADLTPAERIALYKEFLATEEKRIQTKHDEGAGGIEIAQDRATLLDIMLGSLFDCAVTRCTGTTCPRVTLVANGGYGRGTLNPSSDIDLLFLLPQASNKLTPELKSFVEEILYLLWDLGFKVGHSSRSISECISEAKRDPLNRTSLLDMRLIAGDKSLFADLEGQFFAACLEKDIDGFLEERRADITTRHKKFSGTVYLQEPNVKESPGGMRDFQNLMWVLYAQRRSRDLNTLVKEKLLSPKAYKELLDAFEFLHHVRNELHYTNQSSSDILTLRLQGVIADAFKYPQPNILRRIESFMRDYYTHAKNIHQHTTSIFEIFEIEIEDRYAKSWSARLLKKGAKRERFSAYYSLSGRIYPINRNIFEEDFTRLMRLFLHSQKRSLRLSPPMRKLIKANSHKIDNSFRADLEVRKAFRQILEKKGDIARSLRQMHRVGFLGAFMPEFGALTCLVQHEFFHRYTADEHTLRCIDELDKVHSDEDPRVQVYRKIFRDIPDSYPLIIALLLHDAGRAENVREHIDGSAVLAADVCNRLKIRGEQRRLITFLVDHHLTLFRYATKKDIDDPEVVAEFAAQMKEPDFLDAMLLFTYVDSKGTNDDGWTMWKESLILRLYRSAKQLMETGQAGSREEFEANKSELLKSTLAVARSEEKQEIEIHFGSMPDNYLRYRYPRDLAIHARAIYQYKTRRADSDQDFECAVQWIEKEKLGFTDLVIATEDRPYLFERIAFVLAKANINILSADVYTRDDGVVLDILRVTTKQGKAVTQKLKQESVVEALYKVITSKRVSRHDLVTTSIMDNGETGMEVPTRAWIDDDDSSHHTVIEVQAVDRLGLLFEILRAVRRADLITDQARICTEKGAAMDRISVCTVDGKPATDQEQLDELIKKLNKIIAASDPTQAEEAVV